MHTLKSTKNKQQKAAVLCSVRAHSQPKPKMSYVTVLERSSSFSCWLFYLNMALIDLKQNAISF